MPFLRSIVLALAGALVALPLAAAQPNALAILVNGGATPVINVPFDLKVRANDGFQFLPVTSATSVALSHIPGSGTLSGLTGCVIPAGASDCTVSGLTYSSTGFVILDAAVTSGDALAAYHGMFFVDKATPTMSLSSTGPSSLGQTTTFTATITGAAPTGNVFFKAGDTVLCNAAPVTGTGNARTATCATAALPVGAYLVVALYDGDAQNNPWGVGDFTHFVYEASNNVALAANGGVATASSTIAIAGANFGVAAVNDGVRTGVWGSGGGWNDATGGAFPDWVQVQFNGTKTIDKVVVTTLQDNFAAPVEPTDATTFSQYGITAFQVQTWNGSSWTTRATVTGNTLVKRTVTFPSVTTSRIRILVTGALASYSRIVEVEAWTVAPTTQSSVSLASGANPSTYPFPITFTATVTGNAPTGNVSLRETLTGTQLCTGALVAGKLTCVVQFLLPGDHPIVATYHGDTNHIGAASAPFVQVVQPAGAGPMNVALAANGAVASASSTYSAAGIDFGVAAVNDGIRTGTNWGHGAGGGWADATANQYPDWVEIAFDGPKSIYQVVVVTLADGFATAPEPTDATTFTQWGVTAFDVQTWNGGAWVTRASITGNTLVKRTVTFTPVATTRMRVLVHGARASYARIVELEAWSNAQPIFTYTTLASSANPSTGGLVTFTATVTDAFGGDIRFDDGTVDLCPPVPASSGTAQCTVALPVGTHAIYARYSGSAGVLASFDDLLQQVLSGPVTSNVALAANGGVATASSTIAIAGANFGVAAVNDGVRTGVWGSGGGWNDATGGAFPDWVQVQFNGTKTIDKVVVTTLQDNFAAPVEPTDATTFSQYGITAFQVQTWNGSSWTTRATVTGNTLVKRTVTFPSVTTSRIRILVTGALASYSRIVEVEAWTAAGASAAAAAAADDTGDKRGEAPALVKANGDAESIPTLAPAALAMLAWLVALIGLRERRRRLGRRP